MRDSMKRLLEKTGFGEQVKNLNAGKCAICAEEVGEFRDDLSRREYELSGMCQKCQDETFGEEDEEEPLVGEDGSC